MKIFSKDAFEKRIHEIDLFRGFLILLVIFDHLMWFINFYIFHNTQPFLNWYWTSAPRFIVRQVVLCLFLFTCGISCHLSRNNKKRGLILLAICILITVATHLLQLLPTFSNRAICIDFNILGVIALSILIYVVCDKLSDKNLLLVTCIMMVFYFFIIASERESAGDMTYYPFKSILYVPFNPIREAYVGDYLPLFPYAICLPLGVLFARRFYQEKKSIVTKKGNWEKPICFLGRHTLLIYIGHEILFTLIFMGIGALL